MGLGTSQPVCHYLTAGVSTPLDLRQSYPRPLPLMRLPTEVPTTKSSEIAGP